MLPEEYTGLMTNIITKQLRMPSRQVCQEKSWKVVFLSDTVNQFRPVTRGADQDEEEDVDCERVEDGDDGAFGDGNTRSLQLPFRDMRSGRKHQDPLPPTDTKPQTLTAQVVPQSGGVEARVAGVVAGGLVVGPLVDEDKITWYDHHGADEDGQQGHGDHQQDDEGGAGVDVGAHQTHEQTQQQHHGGVEHRVPVALWEHAHPLGHRGL
ncbi:hypothetical protein EYF80_017252 [Liparis tanakae]|uniref:Uncharacterized protein n=1 Tax=Liparis tanakae TaxID=230148 RepID=A0A4Z2I323_9TELE|nr:hypothetical protein EYF80_017252 [Liparis tanakae]